MLKIIVDESKCDGCYLCVEGCPDEILELGPQDKAIVVAQDSCLACRNCEHLCPRQAIVVELPNWVDTQWDKQVVVA